VTATLNTSDIDTLEELFRALSDGIEQAGPEHERLYLAKLAMVLASHVGDAETVRAAIRLALADL